MNQAAVEQLVMMGFPVNASRRALFNSANNVEMAMDWLCTHIDDPDYNDEFTEPTNDSSVSASTKPSESELSGLPDQFKIFKEVIGGIECPSQNDKIFKEECIVTCDSCFSKKAKFKKCAHPLLFKF